MPGDGTKAVHGGAPDDHRHGPVGSPLERTSTYRFETIDDLRAASAGADAFYTRYGHPNFERVERAHAALHGTESSVLFGSGMAAIAGIVLAHARTRDRIVVQKDVYGGTQALLEALAADWGLQLTWVDTGDLTMLDAALAGARLYMGENPTNPLLKAIDLEAIARLCQQHGALFVLDATFDGPINLKPVRLGVDLIVESATKSLGGHSDLLAGLVTGSEARCAPVRNVRKIYGAASDPDTAWLLERGMKTLPARIARQNATALDLAQRLEADERVGDVFHPALASHPDRSLIQRLAAAGAGTASGSMIAFHCAGGGDAAIRFCESVALIANAPSLGGVESLVSLPRFTSHAAMSPDERTAAGITDDLVRLSIGQEDPDDLWADIDAALG